MDQCSAVRSRVPDLLVEALDPVERESVYQHIESCPECRQEWEETRRAWGILGEVPELPVPESLSRRFESFLREEVDHQSSGGEVVPFRRRSWLEWAGRAAAVAVLVGGSFFAGRTVSNPGAPRPSDIAPTVAAMTMPIGDNVVLPASFVSPQIKGRPDIRNVNVTPEGSSGQIAVSFDLSSTMTIKGRPDDPSLVQILSYVLQNQSNPTHARSRVMQWVKDTYSDGQTAPADPEIIRALANVLRNDTHEGVRIKAVDTLRSLPLNDSPEAREALIFALRNDPNPAVRMKSVDALSNLAITGGGADAQMLDTLREKASQDGENVYVRVKAAEALKQIDL